VSVNIGGVVELASSELDVEGIKVESVGSTEELPVVVSLS